MADKPIPRTCAIYTRKSSDEGLEQEFNSLDAQREAGDAYVKSQAHEGWILHEDHYDDGGISGGTLERPALKQLLTDIKAGKIHIVVVYKVDRLSRSLSDFAKLVDVFEKYGVSFVSVTQQFNTTTSMGRLMLNVLLSFAQFEREVTGERIRDKIQASRKKGMWMGGNPPLGYDIKERKLVVNEPEAELIRLIFRRYTEFGCVAKLQADLNAQGHRTKRFLSATGRVFGDCQFSRGHLYHLLKNRVYLGCAVHKGTPYPGEHEAIVDQALWDRVKALLDTNRHEFRMDVNVESASLLKGIVFDDAKNRMTPTHGKKNELRYRYYVSQAIAQGRPQEVGSVPRLPATDLENLVTSGTITALEKKEAYRRFAGNLKSKSINDRNCLLRKIVKRVVVSEKNLEITIDPSSVIEELSSTEAAIGEQKHFIINVPYNIRPIGTGTKVIAGGDATSTPNISLIKGIIQGFIWRRKLTSGEVKSVREIAKSAGVTHGYVRRIMRLGFLAPDLIEAALAGDYLPGLSMQILRRRIPLDWVEQRQIFLRGSV